MLAALKNKVGGGGVNPVVHRFRATFYDGTLFIVPIYRDSNILLPTLWPVLLEILLYEKGTMS
jgi:hypothetical protein